MLKAAVVLCGCGRGDGSEIHESVSCLIHLARLGVSYQCFAPDLPQAEVVNHATGKTEPGQTRNMLVEAARIARGEIRPLAQLHARDFDLCVFPGGFGAAKNLCSFAKDGPQCSVLPDAARVLKEFHGAGKPLALCCIAPVLAAKVLGTGSGGPGCEVTLGHDDGVARAVAAMGARHVQARVTEAHVDEAQRIATSPAYMEDARPHEVFEGIGRMIEGAVRLCARRPEPALA